MLQTKEIISTKYAVPGYISTKHIRGHEYKYLQLRGYDGKIKSIYLAGEGLKVCENALNIQKALKNNENISAEYKKLLDGATGLSLKKCLLFKIIWKENKYVIRIYNGKEITEMPMIFLPFFAHPLFRFILVTRTIVIKTTTNTMAKSITGNPKIQNPVKIGTGCPSADGSGIIFVSTNTANQNNIIFHKAAIGIASSARYGFFCF